MKRQHILLMTTNLGKGGAQRVFHDHAKAFSQFSIVEEAIFDLEQDDRIYNSGLPLHGLKQQDWISNLGAIGRLLSRSLALRRLVATRKYDLVISHMDGANWVNVLSFSQARKILVVHGTIVRDQNIRGIRQWLRLHIIFPLLYNLASQTIAVSEGIARELTQFGNVRKVKSIPNFFEIDLIQQQAQSPLTREMANIFNRQNVLVTSGRLSEQKKQAQLIDVLAGLLKRGVDTRLVILGDGELRDRLVQKCLDLSLNVYQVWDNNALLDKSYNVYFLGYVSNPYQYLFRGTLFLFSSEWEGYPLALCEAMISGLPVVSTDCPTGPREILAPGTVRDAYDLRTSEIAPNGMLMPMIQNSNDLKVWVETVEQLLSDEGLRKRFAKQGKLAMRSIDREIIITQWKQIITTQSAPV